jgi:hypothetical protein
MAATSQKAANLRQQFLFASILSTERVLMANCNTLYPTGHVGDLIPEMIIFIIV